MKIILILVILCSLPLSAEIRRVYVGSVDLAGLVPDPLPDVGHQLVLPDPVQPAVDRTGRPIGYFPVLFRSAVTAMQAQGVRIHLEVDHAYVHPRPGKFLRVLVWAETSDLSLIEPLQYDFPIQPDHELSAYD